MATINQNQIAATLGVSRSTVSYVLSGKAKEKRISDEVVRRVRVAAEQVNYKPHGFARSLSRQRTKQIGILLRNAADRPFDNPPVMEFLMGINLRLEVAGFVPVFVRVGDVRAEDQTPSRVFSEHMLDGIIAIGPFDAPLIERLKQLSATCIWLDGTVWEPRRCIRRDERDAGRQAAQMAIAAGYKSLVWYGGKSRPSGSHYSLTDRERGMCETATAAGLTIHQVDCVRNFDKPMQQAMIPLLKPDVAWVAYNTFGASRLNYAAGALGLRAGVDFGLVCCEEWEDTRCTWPELSRVTFNRLDMGVAAADMLMDVLRHSPDDCESRVMGFPIHRGATLLGPAAHEQGEERSTAMLLERIADPRVSSPWDESQNSVADRVGKRN